jgi:uracil-DNA glycosylase family 4
MPFIEPTNQRRTIQPSGPKNAKIAIIGDFSDGFDERTGRPFSGPTGTVLEQCLHAAGLIRGEVYTTNVVLSRVDYSQRSRYFDDKKNTISSLGQLQVERLQKELQDVQANVFVAAGSFALSAISGLRHLSKYRGYVFTDSILGGNRKVIPTHHPGQTIRGMYSYRYMIVCDLKKAKIEGQYPELRRPERTLIYHYENIEEALQWLEYFEKQPKVGFDIEVLNYEISCISFSSSPDLACVFPITGWELDDELFLWRGIQKVLGNPHSIKIIQNSMFDVPFLLTRNGIEVRGPIHDTMVAHSIMYPELPKGLGFLGSVYCSNQEYWKDTVKFSNIKDEA